MDFEQFTNRAKDSFRFLNEKYSFSEPEIENLGREIFIRFHRNDETVSISMEAGSAPIVELFLLCEGTKEKFVPWAARNNKSRFRKFPNLVATKDFFTEAPKELERVESDWLKT
jgi:hypothetical protein